MCSNIVTLTPWDLDISQFKDAEKRVADNFIFGVIELGKILKEKRDKYKPKGKWGEYLEEINKSLAGANQFIRIFEYAEKDEKGFYNLNLTNWERINKFLALPENLRLQLAKEISGQNITDEEFKKNLCKIKGEMPEENLKDTPKMHIILKGIMHLKTASSYLIIDNFDVLTVEEKKLFIEDTKEAIKSLVKFFKHIK